MKRVERVNLSVGWWRKRGCLGGERDGLRDERVEVLCRLLGVWDYIF